LFRRLIKTQSKVGAALQTETQYTLAFEPTLFLVRYDEQGRSHQPDRQRAAAGCKVQNAHQSETCMKFCQKKQMSRNNAKKHVFRTRQQLMHTKKCMSASTPCQKLFACHSYGFPTNSRYQPANYPL
jgi:hypothetical protein